MSSNGARAVKLSKEERKRLLMKNLRRDKYLMLMFFPVLLYYLIFSYLPMTGLVMAFQNFIPGRGLTGIYSGE